MPGGGDRADREHRLVWDSQIFESGDYESDQIDRRLENALRY